MPGYVAENFVECLLFTLAACEHAGIRYVAHWGTLLGAHRLGGVCPWDEDADIFLLGEDRASVERKLRAVIEDHGLSLIPDPGGHFWVRQRPWWAGQGHVALEFMPERPAAAWPDLPDWDPWLPTELIEPRARYPFHGAWIWGPSGAEAVLARLYRASGSAAALRAFRRPALRAGVEGFWSRACPAEGPQDWDAISARMRMRVRTAPWGHVATFPWWWFNGTYNVGVRWMNRLGRALAAPQGSV